MDDLKVLDTAKQTMSLGIPVLLHGTTTGLENTIAPAPGHTSKLTPMILGLIVAKR